MIQFIDKFSAHLSNWLEKKLWQFHGSRAKKRLRQYISDEKELKIAYILIDNHVKQLLSLGSIAGVGKRQKLLSLRVNEKFLQYMFTELRGIVGIQPLQAPVGLMYSLGFSGDPRHIDRTMRLSALHDEIEQTDFEKKLDEPREESEPFSLQIKKVTVTATTHRMRCMMIDHAPNSHVIPRLEDELVCELARNVLDQIKAECVHTMIANAHLGVGLQMLNAPVTIGLHAVMNEIATRCYRGAGNVIIAPAAVIEGLHALGHLSYNAYRAESSLDLVGYYQFIPHRPGDGNSITVFYSKHVTDTIIAYRGKNVVDSGLFFCPYIIPYIVLQVDPMTFEPTLAIYGRYGIHTHENANRYFSRLPVVPAPLQQAA